MALSRFGMGMVDPFTPYTTGRDPFDDFFTSSITPWLGGQAGALAQRAPAQQLLPPMHLDIKESDTAYELSCDAPGLNKDDIDITFEDNVLRISAERKEEKREESDRFHLQERRWGSVSRSVRLPKVRMRALFGSCMCGKHERPSARFAEPR